MPSSLNIKNDLVINGTLTVKGVNISEIIADLEAQIAALQSAGSGSGGG